MLNTKIATALVALSISPFAFAAKPAQIAIAEPLGITVGKTTCEEAEKLTGSKGSVQRNGRWGMTLVEPAKHYPQASSIQVFCHDASPASAVGFVLIEADKGGMGNPGPREAYATLAGKYKHLMGKPIPKVGDGNAIFNDRAGNFIQIEAKHLSFKYQLLYTTPQVNDFMAELRRINKAPAPAAKL